MDENYKIYVHIFPNGKLYIGQTKQKKLDHRFGKNGNGYHTCPVMWKAIQKYGWYNIKHVLLFDNLSHDMANIIEEKLIEKYNTNNSEFGYNVADGGHYMHKLKKIYRYDLDGNFICEYKNCNCVTDINVKPTSIYCSILKSNDLKNKFSYKSASGYLWSYYKKDKIPPYKNKNEKYVYCYEANSGKYVAAYKSLSYAAKSLNIKVANIQYSCVNDNCSAGGYIWKYYKTDFVKPLYDNHFHRTVKIYQYDKYGTFISEYETLKEAGEKTKIDTKRIIEACKGRTLVANNYIWMYERDDKLAIKISHEYFKKHKIIYQYDLDGNYLAKYENVSEIIEKYKNEIKMINSPILTCLNKKGKSAYGFMWSYDFSHKIQPYKKFETSGVEPVKIYCYDKNTKQFLCEYVSAKDALLKINENPNCTSSIYSCCAGKLKSAYGYIWSLYKNNYWNKNLIISIKDFKEKAYG